MRVSPQCETDLVVGSSRKLRQMGVLIPIQRLYRLGTRPMFQYSSTTNIATIAEQDFDRTNKLTGEKTDLDPPQATIR